MIPFLSAVKPGCLWISAAKGIENESLLTMTGIMKEILGEAHHPFIGCLSGPSFAREVARELPTAISLGALKKRRSEPNGCWPTAIFGCIPTRIRWGWKWAGP